ncbi:MAG: HAD family hydrolase [Clostridia bacterium]|nr:HAD family hydrolase [Clostridia bacterium]
MDIYGSPNPQKIKVIVFDFDETMYFSPSIKVEYNEYIKRTVMALSNLTEEETLLLMDKLGFTAGGEKRLSFTKNCESFGVSKHAWDEYRLKNFFEIDYSKAQIAPNALYQNLAKKYVLYIASNEVLDNVLHKAKRLGIDLAPFKEILAPSPKTLHTYQSKEQSFMAIQQKEGCHFDEMMMIGDRYNVDIKPLEDLGGHGVLVQNTNDIVSFFKSF